MTRRAEPDVPLTREELAALSKKIGALNASEMESFYHAAYRRCQLVNKPPSARSIQELVAAWKRLRALKRPHPFL